MTQVRGIDISQHQSTTPSLEGLGFIVLRATINLTKDTKYTQHYAAARAAGLPTMAYHFNGPRGSDVIAQADLFTETAKAADFLWLDQETFNSTTAGFSDAEAQKFIDRVRETRPCGLYHSSSGFGGVSADAKWVADWRAESIAAGYPRTTGTTPVEFPGWSLWQTGVNIVDQDVAKDLTALLRIGYIAKKSCDTLVHELEVEVTKLTQTIAGQEDRIGDLNAENNELSEENDQLEAKLAAAPGIERERIAQVEAERIRNV